MRVLLLQHNDDLYGSSKILLDVIRSLKKRGIEVIVAVPGTDGPLSSLLSSGGIEINPIRLGTLRRKYLNILGMLNRAFVLTKASIHLYRLIKRRNINLVYTNTTSVLNGAILKILLRSRIKHYWHIHEIIQNSKLFNGLLSRLMKYMDVGVCVSDAVRNHWQSLCPKQADSFKRIYNGFVTGTGEDIRAELGIDFEAVVITMVGRISETKGPDFFVEIAKKSLEGNENLIFLIVGDCYPGNEYMVENLNERIGDRTDEIRLLGFRSDVNNILKSSDILILPSVAPDSLPTVILEAMSFKLPVITTTTGGAGEMVYHEENGYHVDVWDVATASDYVKLLAKDPKRRKEMGNRGYELLISKFGIERFEKELLTLIEGKEL